jgi:UDP-N-acetylmuramoylalanine--D-glutamate ligase
MKPRPPIPPGPYLVLGLARSGVAAARVLRARGQEVIGVDAGAPPAAGELARAGVELHLNDDGVAQLDRVGTVVKSPGVPAQAPAVLAARARGLAVLGELELAWRLLVNEFIAVTGTNGKTTTVELVGHIHREAGLAVVVAGNVGLALSGLVGEVPEHATIVCEASSFQLEDTLAFAPEAAVLLNITPDHLDRHGTIEAYRAAKLQAFAHQGAADIAVLPARPGADGPLPSELWPTPKGRLVRFGSGPEADCALREGRLWWGEQPLLAAAELRLRGVHNVENALAAAAVCLARGIDLAAVRSGLRSFAGVAHRLEEVARRGGVLFVNDSKATNVASTLVALAAFDTADAAASTEGSPAVASDGARVHPNSDGARVHLILGGQGKGQDFEPLRAAVRRGCRAVYLIGEASPAIARALEGEDASGAGVPLRDCRDLERALAAAVAAATPGEVVLLSPAGASFDQFADYEDRGESFRTLVARLG